MRRTILLADDSPTIQRLVASTFADAAFEVISVSNGDAALRKLDEIRPDIVLADIYMPGKNGYEVCSHVKAHATLGGTPVVLLVGAFDVFDEQKATQIGASASITKPFEPQALVELVNSLLEGVSRPPEPVIAAAPPSVAEAAPAIAVPVTAPAPEPAAPPVATVYEPQTRTHTNPPDPDADLLGLEQLFRPQAPDSSDLAGVLSDQEIDRIADRVIQRLSTQAVESIAWDVVPDIAERVLREELKKTHES